MKYDIEDKKMTIYLEGRIDAGNSKEAEDELMALSRENPGVSLILDAAGLEYISSAGLRVLMRLRKSRDTLQVINTSPEVYEIFSVTGFTQILDVSKKLRFVSAKGLKKLGAGVNGTVYTLDDESILKTVKNMTLDAIKSEMEVSRTAFVYGIPTAIAYDVVETEEGYGEIYEMMKAGVFSTVLVEQPERRDEFLKEFVRIYREIHGTDVAGSPLPGIKKIYLEAADTLTQWLEPDEVELIKKFIAAVPERTTFIHGDFHLGNIMLQDGELILIDIGEAAYGHPIFDLAQTCWAFYMGININHEKCSGITGLAPEEAKLFLEDALNSYFGTEGKQLEDQKKAAKAMGLVRSMTVFPMQGRTPSQEDIEMRVKLVRENLLPHIDELCEIVKDM